MRRGRPVQNVIGIVMVLLGVFILLAMILPSGFWWIILAIGLIILGFNWARRC